MKLRPVKYEVLNARQKEAYNFQKVSGVLADFGYCTIRLSQDWSGADFIAQHIDGSFLKVQLKSRLTFAKKYERKHLWICFQSEGDWYLYPHDRVLAKVKTTKATLEFTESWSVRGGYSFPTLGKELLAILKHYRVPSIPSSTRPALHRRPDKIAEGASA